MAELKKGVVPVFAAGTYNPKEKVVANGERTTLSQYAGRQNITLLRPADFNEKLRERGVDKKVTVQRICSLCKDERDVRKVLGGIWMSKSKIEEIIVETTNKNQEVFAFEKSIVS
jgi:hypothetical protein